MEDTELVKILKQEEADAASYQNSELAKAQEEALNRYFGRPYGDEVANRSRVVSHDVEDTINWIMPDLMRCFTSADDLVSVKASSPEDDDQYVGAPQGKSKADVMAAFLAHIYFEDNRGTENTHDFLFDGLLQRLGVMKVSWADPEPGPPMMVEGVGEQQLVRYLQDPEYEILGYDQEDGQNGPVFLLEVRRTPRMGRVHIEAVPPEEFALHKAAKSIDDSKYHRRRRLAYLSELKRQYPDQAILLQDVRGEQDDAMTDGRRAARYPDDNLQIGTDASDDQRREVYLCEEYIRIDYDGDGIVELRHIKRVGDVVLENIAVSASDYKAWTPSRVSHRVAGRSVHDMLADITKIRTVITRRYLDALAQTVTPRTYVNTAVIDQTGVDTIADNDIGAVVPVKGDPHAAVYEAVTPDVSGPALTALEYFDGRGSEATGVTKQSQGMDPQAMNKTASGIDLLQAAAKTRIEMFARWAGVALEDVFKHILRLVAAHQDGPRMVKLFGQWCEIDPRTWSDEMAVKVDVGSAGVSKHQRISNLLMISQKQEQVLATAGPTPLVTLQHLRNSYASLVSDMGFPDPTLYFGDIPEDWAPEPQPDPRMMEVQAKTQLAQAEAQHTAQVSEAKLAHEVQIAQVKAQSDRELQQMKLANELQIAQMRIAAETEIARERTAAEIRLAAWKAKQDVQIAKAQTNAKIKANGGRKPNGAGEGVRMGGQIG